MPQMRMRALVKSITGKTEHYVASISVQGNIEGMEVDEPKTLELIDADNGYLLLRLNSNNECVADTWHASLAEAKSQAEFEYSVASKDWEFVDN